MLLLILVILSLIEIFFSVFFLNVVGISPDFPRQEIVDEANQNLNDIDINTDLKDAASFGALPMDIISYTYVSDGRNLNGTIWLSDPISSKNHKIYVNNNLTFGVFIYAGTTVYPAYSLVINPQQDGTWTKTLFENEPYLPSGPLEASKIIDTTNNYTGFFQEGNRYMDFSVDLGKISYPNMYWLDVQTSAINSVNGMNLFDSTFVFRAPPLESEIDYDWEKPIKVRAGTESIFKLFINYTDLPVDTTQLFTDANSTDGIHISFKPDLVTLEGTGTNYTDMSIKIDENVYTNAPTKVNQIINIGAKTEENFTSTRTLLLDIEVIPPLSLGDILVETNLVYVIPIGITAVIVVWISKKIDKIKNYQRLSVEDLLTVDASVIAGVLIFLTIGTAEVFAGSIQRVGILTASIVFPFALAAIRTLIKGEVETYGVKLTVSGFIYLMTSVIVIGFVNS